MPALHIKQTLGHTSKYIILMFRKQGEVSKLYQKITKQLQCTGINLSCSS